MARIPAIIVPDLNLALHRSTRFASALSCRGAYRGPQARRFRRKNAPRPTYARSFRRPEASPFAQAPVRSRSIRRSGPPQRDKIGVTLTVASSSPARCARTLDQSRPSRIERHIARRRHQMLLVHDDGAKARLKQMPGQAQPRIDDAALTPMRFAQGAAECLRRRGREDPMHMIGHRQYDQISTPALRHRSPRRSR